jgi:glycine oxidase
MRVAVVGGGIVGLSVAWRCAQRGHDVTVYDPHAGGGAALVAAGMLAPVAETAFGEVDLRDLLVTSAARWPSFAAELGEASGVDVGYRSDGTLFVALTDDDHAELNRLVGFYRRVGRDVIALTARELRDREPLLSPRVRGGAFAPGDHQVDPRRVLEALGTLGLTVEPRTVASLDELDADVTVVAAGVGSAGLTGLPVRPVKGQSLRLRAPEAPVRHVIRGYVNRRHVYVVPRVGGEIVVGATEEERGPDTTVTAGAVLDLLRGAVDLVPGLAECVLTETLAGLRPGTPDNAPIIGRLSPTVLVATGHYRNGVLLTPITADVVAGLVDGRASDVGVEGFRPERFS